MRRLTPFLLILFLPACTGWQPVALPTPETAGWSATGKLRVTTHWGTQFRGDSIWIAGDTLRIRAAAESTASVTTSRVASLERHGFDGRRTLGLGIGMSLVGLLGALMAEGIKLDIGSLDGLGSP